MFSGIRAVPRRLPVPRRLVRFPSLRQFSAALEKESDNVVTRAHSSLPASFLHRVRERFNVSEFRRINYARAVDYNHALIPRKARSIMNYERARLFRDEKAQSSQLSASWCLDHDEDSMRVAETRARFARFRMTSPRALFFPARLHGRHDAGAYRGGQDAARPVRSSDRRATQPETGSAAFCPAAHEQ